MGLQIYTGRVQIDNKQIIKTHSDQTIHIIDLVETLKKSGYEILDFPPIENNRKVYSTILKVKAPEEEKRIFYNK
jgi:hypothetical protein